MKFLFKKILLILIILIHFCDCTLGPGDKKKKTSKKSDSKVNDEFTLSELNVQDRKLVKQNIDINDIIQNNKIYCAKCSEEKSFPNKVLGYVTPWNSRGYDITKIFSNKFNFVSPVWLQIKRNGKKKYHLTGSHDIDLNWLNQVKQNSKQTSQFLPRILFENLKMQDLHALFNDESEIQSLAKMLVDKSLEYNFDGYVFEIYLQLQGHSKSDINHLVSDLADILHLKNKLLFLVIPPVILDSEIKTKNIIFTDDDFDLLKDKIDGFSLMTYDYYSHSSMIAPNAPIKWIEENVLYLTQDPIYREKILLGLNFYGMKFKIDHKGKPKGQPEPVVGNSFIELLKTTDVEARFDSNSEEHVFVYNEGNTQVLMFYPTLYSIKQRISLAQKLGTGLSIWELGQGLDYFYDLL